MTLNNRLFMVGLSVVLLACQDKAPTFTPIPSSTPAPTGASTTIPTELHWVAGWKPTSALSITRAGTAAVVANDHLYVIGGVDGVNFVSLVEYAKLNPDGSLSNWQTTSALQEARGFIDAVASEGYIYVVGGGNGPNGKNLLRSVERAKILADGSLGSWEMEANGLITPRRCSKLSLLDGQIYALGGYAGALLNTVERSVIGANGHLGEWHMEAKTMLLPRYVNAVKATTDAVYVIGGHDQDKGVGIKAVEWARPNTQKDLSGWRETSALQVGRYGLSSAKQGRFLYAIGGLTGVEYLNSVEIASLQENGDLSPWRFTTALLEPRATFSAVVNDKWMYIIGGTNQDHYLDSVVYAQINDRGEPGFWASPQEAQDYQARQASLLLQHTELPNQGDVMQVQQASLYTYVYVRSNLGELWLAGPKLEVLSGDRVGFSAGVSMSNFYSKELQQQFQSILFVGRLEVLKNGAGWQGKR